MGLDDEGREPLTSTKAEGLVARDKDIVVALRLQAILATSDGQRLEIGIVGKKDAGVLCAEGMARVGGDSEAEQGQTVAARLEVDHGQDEVIDGAFRVLDDFDVVDASTDSMKALPLQREEQQAFATAALALRYGERGEGEPPAPVTAEQLIEARRPEDFGNSLWTTFQRVQENALRGGQPGRGAKGRRLHTRPVASIDRSVSLNRALWVLAEEMRKLKA